jgi:hypothetical protein
MLQQATGSLPGSGLLFSTKFFASTQAILGNSQLVLSKSAFLTFLEARAAWRLTGAVIACRAPRMAHSNRVCDCCCMQVVLSLPSTRTKKMDFVYEVHGKVAVVCCSQQQMTGWTATARDSTASMARFSSFRRSCCLCCPHGMLLIGFRLGPLIALSGHRIAFACVHGCALSSADVQEHPTSPGMHIYKTSALHACHPAGTTIHHPWLWQCKLREWQQLRAEWRHLIWTG